MISGEETLRCTTMEDTIQQRTSEICLGAVRLVSISKDPFG